MNEHHNLITYAAIEPTSHCVLSCRFCNRRDAVTEPRHMTLDEWDMVLDKMATQDLREVKIQGLGETFLHPQIDVVCRSFRERFPDVYTITSTNCQIGMTENFIKSLPHIDLLYLSVDGYKENYERNRQGAKWDKLVDFLDKLSDIDAGKTRITINYVVNADNYMDLEKVYEMVARKYGFIKEVRINLAQWWGENEAIVQEYDEGFLETLVRYKKDIKGKVPWTYSDCFWPEKGIFVTANGDVRICLLNTTTEPYGNIFTMSMEDILHAPKRLQVDRECKKDSPGLHCRRCDYKRLSPIIESIFSLAVKSR